MTNRLNKLAWVFSLSVFCLGIVLFAARARGAKTHSPQAASFVVTYRQYVQKNGAQPELMGRMIRAVNSQGEWKETVYDASGKIIKIVGADLVASYRVKDDSLQYVDSSDAFQRLNRQAYSEGFFLTNPAFAREDSVAGMKAFVIKSNDGSNGWAEDYYSTKTGFTPLKAIEYDGAANETKVKEAIAIQFRNLAEEEYNLPKLAVKFNEAERLIQMLQAGKSVDNRKAADAILSRLEETKRKLEIK